MVTFSPQIIGVKGVVTRIRSNKAIEWYNNSSCFPSKRPYTWTILHHQSMHDLNCQRSTLQMQMYK